MNDSLKSMFTSDQLELAAAIGSSSEQSVGEKIESVFRELDDPLLSSDDIRSLLALDAGDVELGELLRLLCENSTLENTTTTLRAFDPEDVVLYRLAESLIRRLRIVALECALGDGSSRFQFTCDGRLIRSVAKIDRLDALGGTGQQRGEIRKHVEKIAKGIKAGTQVPNSILLVLRSDRAVVVDESDGDDPGSAPQSFIMIRPMTDWEEMRRPAHEDLVIQRFRQVEIDFPFRPAAFDDEKSATLVDGQQRTAALSICDIEQVPAFFFSINAVIADDEEAKKVFRIANSTVKIETQFSRALLATMGDAPGYLKLEQTKAVAAKALALDDNSSPFSDLIRYPGKKSRPRPPIAYNSLFQVVTIFSDSALPLDDDSAQLSSVVAKSFQLVKENWPLAWGKKPTVSRLTHGVGLRAVSSLIVGKLENQYELHGDLAVSEVWESLKASLARLRDRIVWTDEGNAKASSAVKKIYREQIVNRQNTNQDISALTSFLKKESLDLDSKAKRKKKKKSKISKAPPSS